MSQPRINMQYPHCGFQCGTAYFKLVLYVKEKQSEEIEHSKITTGS